MYLTKIPKFLSIDARRWHHTTYQPPVADHHSNVAAPGFSPYSTATSTVLWRRSPSDPKVIQSNARILRWSDGSLTLQLASNPTQQYEIEGNPLAPRQRNPAKPTPTSLKPGKKDHSNDSYTYLTVPDPSNGLLRVTHKITAGLSILPSAATTDDALEKLQNSLAAISQGKHKSSAGGIEFVNIDEDPELAKKKAEVAEREKDRARKRREAAEVRERERNGRALGRAGLGSRGYGGGLTAGMLEDDETGGGGRQRARAKPKRRQRRNSEYSEDEDFGRKKSNFGNDEYDEEDDFIAGSDEEEVVEDDEDEDDGIVEQKRPAAERAPKRASPEDDDDEDAEGEVDDIPQASRTKRRRVIDDDDE
jgi:RNA polymerase-associated protein LEO1